MFVFIVGSLRGWVVVFRGFRGLVVEVVVFVFILGRLLGNYLWDVIDIVGIGWGIKVMLERYSFVLGLVGGDFGECLDLCCLM